MEHLTENGKGGTGTGGLRVTESGVAAVVDGTSGPVGEVIDTSVAEFAAQACHFGVAPPFGSFVKVVQPERTVYAVVYAIHSGSLEPGGRPVMRGRDGMRDAAIFRENPDLEQLLRTEFAALAIGFAESGPGASGVGERGYDQRGDNQRGYDQRGYDQRGYDQRGYDQRGYDGGSRAGGLARSGLLRSYLPPSPPPLHWSVQPCSLAEVVRLTERLDYFRTILASSQAPVDALLAANVRVARAVRADEPLFAVRAGRELATLLKYDYPRLTAILRALAD
ncbi:MAG: hypothetical protein IT305_17510 [Chloroflexi bacterium]|nr:hypothetical protein [Chloroflexota bacterium]